MGLAEFICFSSTVNQHIATHKELKVKFLEGAKQNKELYNKVLELKGQQLSVHNSHISKQDKGSGNLTVA